jgi:hypothetical protein
MCLQRKEREKTLKKAEDIFKVISLLALNAV